LAGNVAKAEKFLRVTTVPQEIILFLFEYTMNGNCSSVYFSIENYWY